MHAAHPDFKAFVAVQTGAVLQGELPRKVAAIVKNGASPTKLTFSITGTERSVLSRLTKSRGQTVIKVLPCKFTADFSLSLKFWNGGNGVFDAKAYPAEKRGISLVPLKDAAYFQRCVVDAGELCWPNGLELSGQQVFELSTELQTNLDLLTGSIFGAAHGFIGRLLAVSSASASPRFLPQQRRCNNCLGKV